MKKLILFLILLSYPAVSQTVYQANEVDTQAIPSGGAGLLNQFIVSNLQIPFKSSINGLNGKVFVKGTVETDGSMSGLEIIRGIDPLCDQEAIRVLGLYKAWKPAELKGRKVRQTASYHVSFISPPLENLDSTKLSFINYYDEKLVVVKDPKMYKYRSIMPLDNQGILKSDIIYEELGGGKWKQVSNIPFKRKEFWYKVHGEADVDSVKAYEISAEDNYETNYVPFLTFQDNGKLLSYVEYFSLRKIATRKQYYLSGMLSEMENFADSSSTYVSWYDNGQVKNMMENPRRSVETVREGKTINAWERNGIQKVKNGNGRWKNISTTTENGDKILVEEGAFLSGLKQGKWTGKLADSTLYYSEIYENGKLKGGVSFINGEEIRYQDQARQPRFKGGLNEFYKFLGQNIRYPSEAAKKGISGRVFLSFVVCEDGSLCDYEVVKGVRSDIDDEALRVVKKMSGSWEPGELRGQKVRVKYNLPVNFQLQ